MKNELPDEQLNSLLREWKVDAEPHPRFFEGVWRCIARREAEAGDCSWSARWQRWTSALAPGHGFQWGAAAAVMLTASAAWLGHATATSDASTPSASSYLASVDPYRMTP